MVLSWPAGVRVYVANEATDTRKSFDGLSAIVEHCFHRDPFEGDVFAFFNRRRDRVKLLYWDRNGFCIAMKRLERGAFDSWRPTTDKATHVEVEPAQLVMLLEGIELRNCKEITDTITGSPIASILRVVGWCSSSRHGT